MTEKALDAGGLSKRRDDVTPRPASAGRGAGGEGPFRVISLLFLMFLAACFPDPPSNPFHRVVKPLPITVSVSGATLTATWDVRERLSIASLRDVRWELQYRFECASEVGCADETIPIDPSAGRATLTREWQVSPNARDSYRTYDLWTVI